MIGKFIFGIHVFCLQLLEKRMKFFLEKEQERNLLSMFLDRHEYLSTSCVLFVYYSHIKKEKKGEREREKERKVNFDS